MTGRVVVITGGASGIGAASAAAFASAGDRAVIWDRQAGVWDRQAGSDPAPTASRTVDVTDYDAVQKAAQWTEAEVGPIECLVHAAAVGSGKYGLPFTNLHPDDWRGVLEGNVMGTVNVAHAVTPAMRDRNRGSIVMISSVAGQIGSPTDPPYSASKAAMINFAQVMARDLAGYNVRVNTVCPGMVETPLNRSVWQAWNDRQTDDNKRSYHQWAEEKIRQLVPLGRWQRPQDIAAMALFLCSDSATEITGQTINVDGGYVMHS